MPALFPQWSNSLVRVILGVLVVLLFGIPALLMAWVRTPLVSGQFDPPLQPVEFDHRHHVNEVGIDCRYCHYTVERSSFAGVPPTSLCMGCHNQVWNDGSLLEPVRQSYFSGTPIPWRRVHKLPEFVFFNHSIHVTRGIGCVSCHGRVDRMASVYVVSSLSMGWCLDCHRRPERYLRPQDRITDMGFTPAEPQEVLGRRIREERRIQPSLSCSGCHR